MTRLLVIEDSPTQAQELRLILESDGFEVETSPDGQRGLGRLCEDSFDMVLSDILMPGLSGYDLCRQIKGDPDKKDIPVILLTKLVDPMDIIQGLECGADNYITKPYEPDYLLGRIKNILANKSARAERKLMTGAEFSLMGRAITVTSDKQQILDLLITTLEELMRSKEKERERKLAEEALEKSQRFLQSALDALPAQIAVLDESGTIIAVNAVWQRFAEAHPLSGTACGVGTTYLALCEALGQNGTAEASDVAHGIRAVMSRQREVFSIEYARPGPQEKQWFMVRGTRFEGAGRGRVVVVHEDMTEKKKLEAHFLRSQRMESIGTLAGGIAHDLNNVLTPIVMAIDLLKLSIQDAHGQSILTELGTSAARGAEMVQQILLFARGLDGQRMPVQLKTLIRDIEKMMKRTFPKAIEVTTSIPNDLWFVSGYATQLYQTLMNLCVNARDAMPQGGRLNITVSNALLDANFAKIQPEAKPGPYVLVKVTDTGTGIPANVLAKIFDPFFTTKELGKGTGLGLSTALGIVKAHGGFLDVRSEVGKGTEFSIYLPAEHSPQTMEAKENHDLPVGKGELILVVDDETGIRQIAKATLEAHGYQVITADNGAEAVALFAERSRAIQLVLIDMMMPVMDGPATIRALRNLKPDIRIIGASGRRALDKAIENSVTGVYAYLEKPYTAGKLLEACHELLQIT